MKRFSHIFMILMITFILVQCKKDFEPSQPNLMKYELASGWTGKISIITVFHDYTAIKNVDNVETPIEYSSDEIQKLKVLLGDYSSFKRFYKPENGSWADIPTHEIIYYSSIQPDSISIYEPLGSPEIPMDLVNLVELLMSKL